MYQFDVKDATTQCVSWIKEFFKKNGPTCNAVLGISGGKDSGVVAALFTKALGSENVIGVTMPCHSRENDKIDAKLVSDYYGFELINVESNLFLEVKIILQLGTLVRNT